MFRNPPTGKFSASCTLGRQEWSSNGVPIWTVVDSGTLTVVEASVATAEAQQGGDGGGEDSQEGFEVRLTSNAQLIYRFKINFIYHFS